VCANTYVLVSEQMLIRHT